MKNRNKIFTSLAILGSAIFAMVLTTGSGVFEALGLFSKNRTTAKATDIALNSSNAYANGDNAKYISTNFGNNPIEFQYTGCSVMTNGHATMAENGTIGNYRITNRPDDGVLWNNKITGIQSIYPVFTVSPETATLKFKASYDGNQWGDYAALKSGVAYDISSAEPNYIEVKAVGGTVSLKSLTLNFSCIEKSHTGKPIYNISLSTSDAKQNSYFVNENFANFVGNGGLSVSVLQSNGSEVPLASNQYSYHVYNQLNEEITGTFKVAGTYRVVVSTTSLGEASYTITVSTRPVTNISVSPSYKELVINSDTETVQLTATVTPSNATDPTYTWSSTNTNVATVSNTGLVTAVGNGTAIIKATANDGTNVHGESTIEVSTLEVKKYVRIQEYSDLVIGDTVVFASPIAKRAMSVPGSVYMTSVDVSMNNGYLFGNDDILEFELIEGLADPTPDEDEGTSTYAFKCNINDVDKYLYANSDTGSSNLYKLQVGSQLTNYGSYHITIYTDNTVGVEGTGDNKYRVINFDTSDNSFFGGSGYTEDGDIELYKLVTRQVPVEGLSFDNNEITVAPGNNYTITPVFDPADATNKNLTWVTSDPSVATIDNGVVTGVSDGTTIITATTEEGGFVAQCTVHVATKYVTGVTLNRNTIRTNVGNSFALQATIEPEDAADTSVTWSSNSEAVATVNANGVVTAHSKGNADITVTTNDGGFTSVCSVIVSNVEAESISIDEHADQLEIGDTMALTATILPENTTVKDVSWSSSDSTIATIDENGVVTGRSVGTVTITVLSESGSRTATTTIEIVTEGSIAVQNTVTYMFNDRYWGASVNGIEKDWTNNISGNNFMSGQGIQVTSGTSGANGTSPDSFENISKVVVTYCTNSSKGSGAVTVYAGSTEIDTVSTQGTGTNLRTMEFIPSSSRATRSLNGNIKVYVECSTNSVYIASCAITYTTGGSGGGETIINVNGISVSPSLANLTVGGHQQLEATISPSDATNTNYSWSSSNPNIATVSNSGYVTAMSEGSATITATTEDGGYTATCIVNVTSATVHVTGVSLNPTSATVEIDNTIALAATVSPSNATDKSVTWSSSNSSIAAVSAAGIVSGVSEGTATITVRTTDGNKTAQCSVNVTGSHSTSTGEFIINTSNATASYGTDLVEEIGDYDIVFNQIGTSYTPGWMQFKRNYGYILNKDPISGLYSLIIDCGNKSFSGTLYSGTSADNLEHSQTVNGSGTYSIPAGDSFFKIASGDGTYYIISITVSYSTEPVDPTNLSIPASKDMSVGESYTVPVTLTPSNANQNKGITWSSSANSVATVSDGVIRAVGVGSAVITATLYEINPQVSKQITVNVTEAQGDEWTWLIYMCGSDLESGSGRYATSDLREIASVSGQPNDVNVVVEAGGAKSWASTYSNVISSNKLNRFHLSGKNYVSDAQITDASMGSSSTLQSFLEWGINTYPANKIGLIFWNHGGAMDGVCFDEKHSDDSLTSDEISSAIRNAINNTHYGKKLEFIGYDACLMAVQDYAGMTADYVNNMVCSEESEMGSGWDYDTWLDDVFAGRDTNTICKAIIDGFIKEQGSNSDQTLSHIDLSVWDSYETAFEDFASYLKTNVVTSASAWTTFKNTINKATKYGYYEGYEQYNDGYVYDIFDIGDALNCIKSDYRSNSTLVSKIETVLSIYNGSASNKLVHYESHGRQAGNSTGLCLVAGISGINNKSCYTSSKTTLTNWQSLIYNYWNK